MWVNMPVLVGSLGGSVQLEVYLERYIPVKVHNMAAVTAAQHTRQHSTKSNNQLSGRRHQGFFESLRLGSRLRRIKNCKADLEKKFQKQKNKLKKFYNFEIVLKIEYANCITRNPRIISLFWNVVTHCQVPVVAIMRRTE